MFLRGLTLELVGRGRLEEVVEVGGRGILFGEEEEVGEEVVT